MPTAPEILPYRDGLPGRHQADPLPRKIGVPQGEFQAQGDGLGVHPVGPPHHGLVFESLGLFFQYGQKVIQIGQQEVRRLGQAQAQGGVQHVGGGQAEVEVAAVLPQTRGHLVHEGGHVVVGLGLDLEDAGHVDFGLPGGPFRHVLRDEAALGHGGHGGQFHLEPA